MEYLALNGHGVDISGPFTNNVLADITSYNGYGGQDMAVHFYNKQVMKFDGASEDWAYWLKHIPLEGYLRVKDRVGLGRIMPCGAFKGLSISLLKKLPDDVGLTVSLESITKYLPDEWPYKGKKKATESFKDRKVVIPAGTLEGTSFLGKESFGTDDTGKPNGETPASGDEFTVLGAILWVEFTGNPDNAPIDTSNISFEIRLGAEDYYPVNSPEFTTVTCPSSLADLPPFTINPVGVDPGVSWSAPADAIGRSGVVDGSGGVSIPDSSGGSDNSTGGDKSGGVTETPPATNPPASPPPTPPTNPPSTSDNSTGGA